MASTSPYLGLTLPALTEYFSLAVWNGNMTIIDDFAGSVQDHISDKQNPHEVTASQIGAASADDLISVFRKNLIGTDTEYYPVSIPNNTNLTMSTSDGSTITGDAPVLNLYDSDKNLLGFFNFTAGESVRTVTFTSQSGKAAKFVKWTAEYGVPIQVELGSNATTYQVYISNLAGVGAYVRSLEARIEALET